MNSQTEERFKFKDLFNQIEKHLEEEKLVYEDYESFYREIQNIQIEFQNKLEYASETKTDEKRFENLYSRVAGENASILIDRLTAKGYGYKKDLGDAFESMGYRLLEQARAGKRSDVYYGILRIFISYQKKFPNDLVEAFKPIYSIEMFKVFIFSFLSGIIGKEQQKENKN